MAKLRRSQMVLAAVLLVAGAHLVYSQASSEPLRLGLTGDTSASQFTGALRALLGGGPLTLSRDVLIYSATAGTVTLDLAYQGGLIRLEPGVTVTFSGLRLQRVEGRIPIGIFTSSPGASVVLENCDDHLQVGAPADFQVAFFANVPRAEGSGVQQSTVDMATGTLNAVDLSWTVPTTQDGLGGYAMYMRNSQLTADQRVDKPAACPDTFTPGFIPEKACLMAVVDSIAQRLCTLGPDQCVNHCAAQCAA